MNAAIEQRLAEVPQQLKQLPNWLWWKLETRDGKETKVPYVAGSHTKHASSTDASTWTDFTTASKGVTLSSSSGMGFAVHGAATEQQITGFDLDGCRNPDTGEITAWADSIIDALDSYAEITPSQTGIRVWVRGTLPVGDRVFNLDPIIGIGSKVKIEVFTEGRYFTVTGDSIFEEPQNVEVRDLADAYKLCHDIRAKHPAPARTKVVSESSDKVSAQIEYVGSVVTDKLTLLMTGQIQTTEPFEIEDSEGNSLSYPSHSEADMALATLLAIKHGDDAELIDSEFRKSTLYNPARRAKWDRLADSTIAKAIKFAEETKSKSLSLNQMVITVPAASTAPASPTPTVALAPTHELDDGIPEFDRSVVTGIYKKIVDLVCEGTTIPPQFPFLAAKVFIGARMAGKVTFENLDADSSYYGTVIADTGTGKGLAWRRTVEGVFRSENMLDAGVKLIYSADSGAGLKDTFFEPPEDHPVICYIDEVTSLGHKAGEKKNPEIVDTIIELADGNRVSRVLAKRGKQKANRTSENARLSLYVCGQNGEVFMSSFAGKTKLGLWDRFYPEFSPIVEAGDLPEIRTADGFTLLAEINGLGFSGHMTMSPEVKDQLGSFWKSQPSEIRQKVRFKKHLMLDMYMAAFGRCVKSAEVEDLEAAIKIFTRQMVIRRVHFTDEVPDQIGRYLGMLKRITEGQRRRLDRGEPIEQVAKSLRDFQKDTNAYRSNEVHIFNNAWRNWGAQLARVTVRSGNGHIYEKFIPEPNETDTWASPK